MISQTSELGHRRGAKTHRSEQLTVSQTSDLPQTPQQDENHQTAHPSGSRPGRDRLSVDNRTSLPRPA